MSDYTTVVTEWKNSNPLLGSNYSGKIYGDIYGFETDRYFTWDDFASNYLEMTKVDFASDDQTRKINTCAILTNVLTNTGSSSLSSISVSSFFNTASVISCILAEYSETIS